MKKYKNDPNLNSYIKLFAVFIAMGLCITMMITFLTRQPALTEAQTVDFDYTQITKSELYEKYYAPSESQSDSANKAKTTSEIAESYEFPSVYDKDDSIPIININTANAQQLIQLDGIGEVKANAIIEYRDEHGPFTSIEQITEVSGIGEKTFEKIKDKITV